MNIVYHISKLKEQLEKAEQNEQRYHALTENLRDQINKITQVLREPNGNHKPLPTEPPPMPTPMMAKRRNMSKAGRARIAEAQRKRWAEFRRTHPKPG